MRYNVALRKKWRTVFIIAGLGLTIHLSGQAAIELEKMNMLVAGVYNPISIAVNDVPDSCLSLRPDCGRITGTGKGHYIWMLETDVSQATLLLVDSCLGDTIAQRRYRVRGLNVVALLGARYRSQTIGAGTFKAQKGITAELQNDDVCGRCDLIGFSARFVFGQTGEVWNGYNRGAYFRDAVLEHYQKLMPGDQVEFYEIVYRCSSKMQPKLANELVFYIE